MIKIAPEDMSESASESVGQAQVHVAHSLLMAAPKLEVQVFLTFLHMFVWYFITNHAFIPFGVWMVSNLKSKKKFLRLNCDSLEKAMKFHIKDDEQIQIDIVARNISMKMQVLVSGMLCLPSVFRLAITSPLLSLIHI